METSILSLGTGGARQFGQTMGHSIKDQTELVHAALDMGINIFDTSTHYGRSESILGNCLSSVRRDSFFVCTKWPARDETGNTILDPAKLIGSVHKSLARLQTDYIDIMLFHGIMPDEYYSIVENLYPTMTQLKSQGKIRSIVDKYNLKSGKTLIYLGTLIKTRDPFFLFKIIKNLIKEDPEIKLLVVGEGKNPEDMIDYKKYVEVNQLQNNVVFTGRVPRKEVPSYLAAADIGISQFPPNPILKMNSPIKLMEYMNAGLPVVANNYNPEQQNIIKASQGGFCVDYTIKDFCEAILVLIKNQKKGKQMGKNGQIYIRKERNYNKLAQKAEEEMQYKLKKW